MTEFIQTGGNLAIIVIALVFLLQVILPFVKGKTKFLPDGMESKIYEIIANLTSHMKDQSKGIDRVADELQQINKTLGNMSADYHFIREKMESVETALNNMSDRRGKTRGNGI